MKVDAFMIVATINLQCFQNPVGGNPFSYEISFRRLGQQHKISIKISYMFSLPPCRLAAAGGLVLLPCSLLHLRNGAVARTLRQGQPTWSKCPGTPIRATNITS